MPRDDFSNAGQRRIWTPGRETFVSVDGAELRYPEMTAPQQNGKGQFSRGVLLEAFRVKRGKTAPRFHSGARPTQAKKKS